MILLPVPFWWIVTSWCRYLGLTMRSIGHGEISKSIIVKIGQVYLRSSKCEYISRYMYNGQRHIIESDESKYVCSLKVLWIYVFSKCIFSKEDRNSSKWKWSVAFNRCHKGADKLEKGVISYLPLLIFAEEISFPDADQFSSTMCKDYGYSTEAIATVGILITMVIQFDVNSIATSIFRILDFIAYFLTVRCSSK